MDKGGRKGGGTLVEEGLKGVEKISKPVTTSSVKNNLKKEFNHSAASSLIETFRAPIDAQDSQEDPGLMAIGEMFSDFSQPQNERPT